MNIFDWFSLTFAKNKSPGRANLQQFVPQQDPNEEACCAACTLTSSGHSARFVNFNLAGGVRSASAPQSENNHVLCAVGLNKRVFQYSADCTQHPRSPLMCAARKSNQNQCEVRKTRVHCVPTHTDSLHTHGGLNGPHLYVWGATFTKVMPFLYSCHLSNNALSSQQFVKQLGFVDERDAFVLTECRVRTQAFLTQDTKHMTKASLRNSETLAAVTWEIASIHLCCLQIFLREGHEEKERTYLTRLAV